MNRYDWHAVLYALFVVLFLSAVFVLLPPRKPSVIMCIPKPTAPQGVTVLTLDDCNWVDVGK